MSKSIFLNINFFALSIYHLLEDLLVTRRAQAYLSGESCVPVKKGQERKEERGSFVIRRRRW